MNPIIRRTETGPITQKVRELQKKWDQYDPYELAERIVDLQGRVASLKDSSQALKKRVEQLHFQFVFPIVLELKKGFAKEVDRIAKEVFRKQSLAPFGQLDPAQQREIQRHLGG